MKFIIISMLTLTALLFSEEEKSLTKMDRFISNVGTIIKLENFQLSDVEAYSEVINAKVRRATSQDEVAFFLMFIKEDKYSDKSAAIAEDDLQDIMDALENLIEKSKNETSTADYLENKFTTEDGFQIGYGGSDPSSPLWFMTLEKYGKSTILFKSHEPIKKALQEGIDKISSLK